MKGRRGSKALITMGEARLDEGKSANFCAAWQTILRFRRPGLS
jgi:hypothetical protein